MKTRKQKQDSLQGIKEKLGRAKIAVMTSFASTGEKGLTVSALRDLRKTLRPLDSQYVVEKKTLFHMATEHTYPGSLGVAYGYGDPYAVAKALYQFAKKNQSMKLFGALMGSQDIDEAHLMEMAMLPSKDVLIGRLVGMLSYPMRSFAVVLNQIKHE